MGTNAISRVISNELTLLGLGVGWGETLGAGEIVGATGPHTPHRLAGGAVATHVSLHERVPGVPV